MASLFQPGQKLLGRLSTYSVIKELHRAADQGAVYLAINKQGRRCTVKAARRHWRLQNEATVLRHYQVQSQWLRPLEDEIESPSDPPAIVLRYLDSDLRTESGRQRLTRPEIKQVAKCKMHPGGPSDTAPGWHDVKLDNIFVNLGKSGQRFTTIQLGDCGGVVLALLYGGGFHLFNTAHEGIKPDQDEYELAVLNRMHRYFGPFPDGFQETADENASAVVEFIHSMGPPTKPFHLVTRREIPLADRDFILKIMKLDPRDRPTADALLQDEWFAEASEDTRAPL
ncbi:Serine/threonine protein kinase [Podospora aff. communis PSN243]|uniref:Serine/threonine protein kinase n=1 Tax=Podospora aff. communis PSN243 TaxID=3040156 RepID=A0AAV9GDV8_9PEZI|nr:Serine/threonine protein kinase [Podospora aff. communis PSN243]